MSSSLAINKTQQNSCLEKYKDKHIGETLFIVCNGPSLNQTDLNLIVGKPSIAMNRISLIYDKYPKWKPTYFIFCSSNIVNPIWGKDWLDSVAVSIMSAGVESFVDKRCIDELLKNNYQIPNNLNVLSSIKEHKPNQAGDLKHHSFSKDPTLWIDKSGSTVNVALQLAFLMNPKKIVLLGADLGWTADNGSKKDNNHFDKSYRAHIPDPVKTNFQMRCVHQLAQRAFASDKPEVKIYNASFLTICPFSIKLSNSIIG